MRRLGTFVVLLVLAAMALTGCSGGTDPATNITANSATLNAHGSCDGGTPTPCSWYWQWGPTGNVTQNTSSTSGPVTGTYTNVPLSHDVSGLSANTGYEFRICAKGDSTSTFQCTSPTSSSSFTTLASCVSGQCMPTGDITGWHQVVADNFPGTSLNSNIWGAPYDSSHPGGDATQGTWLASHTVVANNMLSLKEYQDSASNDPSASNWTGGGVQFKNSQGRSYGKYEVRMRCDGGGGVDCLALLIGTNNWPPEIDFYEDCPAIGVNTRTQTGAHMHWGSGNSSLDDSLSGYDFTQWHTIGVEWTSSTIKYTIDGNVWASRSNPDNSTSDAYSLAQPQNLAMQTEINDCGDGVPSGVSEVDMQFAWVVVYSPA